MASGGKGGETTTEIPPEFKQRILSTFDRGEKMATTAPMNYTGITQAAPSQATQSSWNQTNDMANLLGLGMASGQPTDDLPGGERLRDQHGMKGYDAHWGYVGELGRQQKLYPERVAAMNELIPGLMDPPTNHRGKGFWEDAPGAAGGGEATSGPGGQMNYDQILKMIRGGGFNV
jgi:hypothetical protein